MAFSDAQAGSQVHAFLQQGRCFVFTSDPASCRRRAKRRKTLQLYYTPENRSAGNRERPIFNSVIEWASVAQLPFQDNELNSTRKNNQTLRLKFQVVDIPVLQFFVAQCMHALLQLQARHTSAKPKGQADEFMAKEVPED